MKGRLTGTVLVSLLVGGQARVLDAGAQLLAGADVDVVDAAGNIALMALLLCASTDPNLRNAACKTASQRAEKAIIWQLAGCWNSPTEVEDTGKSGSRTSDTIRGPDIQQDSLFSTVSTESRVSNPAGEAPACPTADGVPHP